MQKNSVPNIPRKKLEFQLEICNFLLLILSNSETLLGRKVV